MREIDDIEGLDRTRRQVQESQHLLENDSGLVPEIQLTDHSPESLKRKRVFNHPKLRLSLILMRRSSERV